MRSRWYGHSSVWIVVTGEPMEGYSISEVYGEHRSAYAHCRRIAKNDTEGCWKRTAKNYWVSEASGDYMEVKEYLIK